MNKKTRSVAAGEFKQKCLKLIDEVAQTHESLVVTKRGKPVVRVVPLEDDAEIEARVLDRLRSGGGKLLVNVDRFVEPTDDLAGWQTR